MKPPMNTNRHEFLIPTLEQLTTIALELPPPSYMGQQIEMKLNLPVFAADVENDLATAKPEEKVCDILRFRVESDDQGKLRWQHIGAVFMEAAPALQLTRQEADLLWCALRMANEGAPVASLIRGALPIAERILIWRLGEHNRTGK